MQFPDGCDEGRVRGGGFFGVDRRIQDETLGGDGFHRFGLAPTKPLAVLPSEMEVREPIALLRISMSCREEIGEQDAASLGHGREFFEPFEATEDSPGFVSFELGSHAAVIIPDHEGRMFHRLVHEHVIHPTVIEDIGRFLAAGQLVERGLRDVHMAAAYELGHLPEEKRQQQSADVRTVHIGVGHDDNSTVPKFADVEIFADTTLQRLDQGSDFLEAEDLIEPCFFDIQEFSAEGEDRLIDVVSATLGAAARGVTFDQEDFGLFDIVTGAVGELVGHAARVEGAFSLDQLAGFASGFTRLCRQRRFQGDLFCFARMFFEPGAEALAHHLADETLGFLIEELLFGLVVELRIADLDADNRSQAFPQVIAGGREVF